MIILRVRRSKTKSATAASVRAERSSRTALAAPTADGAVNGTITENADGTLTLYNTLGIPVYSTPIHNGDNNLRADVAPGTYLLMLRLDSGENYQAKLIVE